MQQPPSPGRVEDPVLQHGGHLRFPEVCPRRVRDEAEPVETWIGAGRLDRFLHEQVTGGEVAVTFPVADLQDVDLAPADQRELRGDHLVAQPQQVDPARGTACRRELVRQALVELLQGRMAGDGRATVGFPPRALDGEEQLQRLVNATGVVDHLELDGRPAAGPAAQPASGSAMSVISIVGRFIMPPKLVRSGGYVHQNIVANCIRCA